MRQINADASTVSGLSSFLSKTVPAVTYPLDGDTLLTVDGLTRESSCEVLFELDADKKSLPTMILDSLMACPIDTRRQLAANIVLVGGTVMVPGFEARLFQELRHLLGQEPYTSRLKVADFRLHANPAKANCMCWAGASIFGATDAISTRSFTKESFLKDGSAIPDWSDLRFNSVYNDDRHG